MADLFEIKNVSSKEAKAIFGKDTTIYYFFFFVDSNKDLIIKKEIKNVYLAKDNEVYVLDFEANKDYIKDIFENANILKVRI